MKHTPSRGAMKAKNKKPGVIGRSDRLVAVPFRLPHLIIAYKDRDDERFETNRHRNEA